MWEAEKKDSRIKSDNHTDQSDGLNTEPVAEPECSGHTVFLSPRMDMSLSD